MLDVMFDIGFGEMILLAAIALIAIGPKQLPEVARAIGKLLGEVKKTVGEVTSTVATAREETDRAIRKVTEDLAGATQDLSDSIQQSLTKSEGAQPVKAAPIVELPDHPGDPPWVDESAVEKSAENSAVDPTAKPDENAKGEGKA